MSKRAAVHVLEVEVFPLQMIRVEILMHVDLNVVVGCSLEVLPGVCILKNAAEGVCVHSSV